MILCPVDITVVQTSSMGNSKGWSACLLASYLRDFTCNATVSSNLSIKLTGLARPGSNLQNFGSRSDGPFARCYCLVADNKSPKMVFMSTARSIEADRKKTRSARSANAPEEPDMPNKPASRRGETRAF